MSWNDCGTRGPCRAMQIEMHEALATGNPDVRFRATCPHCAGDLRLAVPLAVEETREGDQDAA